MSPEEKSFISKFFRMPGESSSEEEVVEKSPSEPSDSYLDYPITRSTSQARDIARERPVLSDSEDITSSSLSSSLSTSSEQLSKSLGDFQHSRKFSTKTPRMSSSLSKSADTHVGRFHSKKIDDTKPERNPNQQAIITKFKKDINFLIDNDRYKVLKLGLTKSEFIKIKFNGDIAFDFALKKLPTIGIIYGSSFRYDNQHYIALSPGDIDTLKNNPIKKENYTNGENLFTCTSAELIDALKTRRTDRTAHRAATRT